MSVRVISSVKMGRTINTLLLYLVLDIYISFYDPSTFLPSSTVILDGFISYAKLENTYAFYDTAVKAIRLIVTLLHILTVINAIKHNRDSNTLITIRTKNCLYVPIKTYLGTLLQFKSWFYH